MLNMSPLFRGCRQDQIGDPAQGLGISPGVLAPALVVCIKPPQFQSEHRGLNAIHPTVPANQAMNMSAVLAVVPQHHDSSREVPVIRCHRASVSKRAEIFPRIETETSRDTEAPCTAASQRRSVR